MDRLYNKAYALYSYHTSSLKGDFLLKIVLEIWGTLSTGAPHKDQHY